MTVASLLCEVDVRLIAHKQLVSTISQALNSGVIFIAVSQYHTMELATDIGCNRVGWTITHAQIHQPLLIGLGQTGRNIRPVAYPIGTSHYRGLYSKERIS